MSAIPRKQFISGLGSSAAASMALPRSSLAIEENNNSNTGVTLKDGQQHGMRSHSDPIAYAIQADATFKLSPELQQLSVSCVCI
jgi:hypothetical protein